MTRLYMDHHVPASITSQLRRRGVDCLTAAEDGTRQVEDAQLLARATELGRVLFTQDTDLLAIAHAWIAAGRSFAGIVFGRQQGLTIGDAVRDLELIAKATEPEEWLDRVEFLPI